MLEAWEKLIRVSSSREVGFEGNLVKQTSKNKRNYIKSLLDKIAQWNWNAIRSVMVRILLTGVVSSFLGMLILALFPTLKGYYVDGVTKFGGQTQPDDDQVALILLFNTPKVDENIPSNYSTVDRDVWAVYAPLDFAYNLGNFCFDRIEETALIKNQYGASHRSGFNGGSLSWDWPYEPGGFRKDECIDKTNSVGQRIIYGYQTREILLVGNSNFYFPFDNLVYDTVFQIVGTDTSDKNNVKYIYLVPKIAGQVRAPNWDVKVDVTDSYEGEHPGTRIRIVYTRPLLYRLLVPTLLLLMLGVIIVLPVIRETSTFLETLIGIIFGLWSLHEVLIPTDVTWPTMIDPLILSLYALLGLSTLLRVVIIPFWKKVRR